MPKRIGQTLLKTDHGVRLPVEWRIEDIFSHAVAGSCYDSPRFSVRESRWYFLMRTSGRGADDDDTGSISLSINKEEASRFPEDAVFSFGVKRADGTVEQLVKNIRWVFDDSDVGYGSAKILERSDLLRRRSERAPSDVLTLTCNLWVNGLSNSNRLDALPRDFGDLFISKRGCDTVLKVQHKEFPVHKLILAARSAVFEAMLDADMKEKQSGVVDIQDCDPEAFDDFLTYLYSGKFQLASKNIFELYRIAHKYDVEELESACVLFMMGELSAENVCETAILADAFGEKELAIKAREFFGDNFDEISSTTTWLSFMKENTLLANRLLAQMVYVKDTEN